MSAFLELSAYPALVPPSLPAGTWCVSPIWNETFRCIWWVDILGEAVYVARTCVDDGLSFDRATQIHTMGHHPGFVVHVANEKDDLDEHTSPVYYTTLSGQVVPWHDVTTSVPPGSGYRQTSTVIRRREGVHSGPVAVWGSQKGLFATVLQQGMPWLPDVLNSQDVCDKYAHRLKATTSHPIADLPFSQGFHGATVSPEGFAVCGVVESKTDGVDAQNPRKFGRVVAFHVEDDKLLTRTLLDVSSGGMGWSPDGKIFYHVDAATQTIQAYPYNQISHVLDVKQPTVYWTLPPMYKHQGYTLQGLCVDAAGAVWIAVSGLGAIHRLSRVRQAAQATVTGTVNVPGVSCVTSCCFGGPGLSVFYITTARGTTPDQAVKCDEANAGRLHVLNLKGVARGFPVRGISFGVLLQKTKPYSKL